MNIPAQINLFSGEERTTHPRKRAGTSKILAGQSDRIRQLFTLGIMYVFPAGKFAVKELTIDEATAMIAAMEDQVLERPR